MKRLFFLLVLINISYAQTYEYIPVNIGWNLIGALEDGPTVNIISTIPPGIIISSFFGYNNQYHPEDTLARGKGYWVKVSPGGMVLIQKAQTSGPCNGILTVDYEGKTYNTVAIGSQCWLRENLDVGVMIDSLQNGTNNSVIEKYCYRNDTINCLIYGGLYPWNEAMQYTNTPGTQGICPIGWHIPTLADLQTLSSTVAADGNALKAVGQGSGGGEGTNTSGFSALLAGFRNYNGNFGKLDTEAFFWSSTPIYVNTAYYQVLYYNHSGIYLNYYDTDDGFSVRCLKD